MTTAVDAINQVATDANVRLAMLLGSQMESGGNTLSVGDNGTSFGLFQIHLPAHPGVTQAQAEDPVWASQYMLPAYQAAASKVPSSMWTSDPKTAAAQAAFYAERPLNMYPQSRIDAAWSAISGAPGSAQGTTTPNGATATQTGLLPSFSNADKEISVFLDYLIWAMLVLLGAGLIAVGLVLIFHRSNNVVNAVGTVTGGSMKLASKLVK